jgi:predicted DNA-binding transcriptional regulator
MTQHQVTKEGGKQMDTTLLLALLGLVIPLLGVWWQIRKQWLLHSASLVTSLDDRFNSTEWRAYRKQCQERMHAHHKGVKQLDLSEYFPVLPFFENIGYLVHTGALDKKMVWNKFGWFIVGYYLALTTPKNILHDIREKEGEATLWEEFEWLYLQCVKLYRSRNIDVEEIALRDIRISQLFKWESTLLSLAVDSGEGHQTVNLLEDTTATAEHAQ